MDKSLQDSSERLYCKKQVENFWGERTKQCIEAFYKKVKAKSFAAQTAIW